jgi:oligopeptide transport system permease protein
MFSMLARRALLIVPTLWVIATVTFFLMRLAPGGIPPVAREQLMRKYGLDRPLGEQYLRFLSNAVRLDFGVSYHYPGRTVREIIAEAFPVSAELGGWALLLALLFGVPLGVIAALRKNGLADAGAMTLALAGISIPNFVLGPVLVMAFSLGLFLLPPALWQGPASRVLPVITLAVTYLAYIARLTRAGMLEVLRQDYIRTARAKGLSEAVVVIKHAFRLGALPVVSFLGPAAARIVTGSIVVESIFAVPGLGRYLVNAAFNRDYTLVLGGVLFYALLLIVLNLLVDVAYMALDPRIEVT